MIHHDTTVNTTYKTGYHTYRIGNPTAHSESYPESTKHVLAAPGVFNRAIVLCRIRSQVKSPHQGPCIEVNIAHILVIQLYQELIV